MKEYNFNKREEFGKIEQSIARQGEQVRDNCIQDWVELGGERKYSLARRV